jgi:hypothetical protein
VFSCTVGDLIEEKPVQVVYIEGNAQDMIKSLEFFIRNQKKFSRVPIDVLRACVPAENHAKLRQFFAGIEVKELPKPILNPFVAREKAAKARKWYRDMRERRYQAELARGNIPVANYLPEDLAPKPTPETDDLENT